MAFHQPTSRTASNYRKLRIAWSVVWGVAAVLLICLWVRSHWRVDHTVWNGETKAFDVAFRGGQVRIMAVNDSVMLPMGFSHGSFPISTSDSDSEEKAKTIFGFGWEMDEDSITAYIPFWFLAPTCAAVAIFPPLLFKRFSLRTLLMATTLIAIVLGLIVAVV